MLFNFLHFGWYAQPLLMLLVLVLYFLVLLVLICWGKMCFIVKHYGASPVSLMNVVRMTVFDRLPLKISLCGGWFFYIFLSPLGLTTRRLRARGLSVQGLRASGLRAWGVERTSHYLALSGLHSSLKFNEALLFTNRIVSFFKQQYFILGEDRANLWPSL